MLVHLLQQQGFQAQNASTKLEASELVKMVDEADVDAAYAAAIAAGATDNGRPGARVYYDPRYYAGNVLDPDGYSLEFVYKSWQH